MFICFVGIDGSGKTLQAEKLAGALAERGIPCAYTWCRYSPRLLEPLNKLAKRLIRRRRGGSEYSGFTSSKRGILRKPIIGWAWLNLSLLDYLMQVRSCFRGILESGKVLICDRFVYDMLADLAINFGRSGEGVAELARHPLIRRFPKLDRVFFLDVPPDVAWARKKDPNVADKQYLVDRADAYSTLSDSLGFTRIDGTRSIEEIAEEVLRQTIECIEGTKSEVTSCHG